MDALAPATARTELYLPSQFAVLAPGGELGDPRGAQVEKVLAREAGVAVEPACTRPDPVEGLTQRRRRGG